MKKSLKLAIDYQEFVNKYKSYGINIDEELVIKAIDFAVRYHGNQLRESGDYYYYHPLEVAEIVAQMRLDTKSIITAILHDTVEDTVLSIENIRSNFGDEIARLVNGVTKVTQIESKKVNIQQAENFRKLLLAISEDIRVLLIKLADRLHNMRTIDFIQDKNRRNRIATETIEIYAPLAERIGAQEIKNNLQDISFRVLYPDVRSSILARFDTIVSSKNHLVDKIVDEIKKIVCKDINDIEVYGRRKTAYSTWMKMQQKNIGLDSLSDIIAFRIIVNSTEECYQVFGIIHNNYQMVPGSFQDFISIPKNNGYQSLHTVVIGPFSQKIEIQIRTKKMHDIAEWGIAAHWRYKQGYYSNGDVGQYNWIRELLFILDQNSDPEKLLQHTKMAMYYNQVFCFTPEGKLIALPSGATPVDFAYQVHSNIGNHCVGAKINGRIAKLNTQLVNGDQVEIITKKDSVVSLDWEKFVVTGKAKSEIQKAIKYKKKDLYILQGKNIVNTVLKELKINNNAKLLQEISVLFKKDLPDLFFSIGNGSISKEALLTAIKNKNNKNLNSLSPLLKCKKVAENNKPHFIKGLFADILVDCAKCCYPLPNDNIIGIVNTGKVVSIHRVECSGAKNYSNFSRIINLEWNDNIDNYFIASIKVALLNRPATLSLISGAIARAGGNIINISIVAKRVPYLDIIIEIEVLSQDHINSIINILSRKKVVQNVGRIINNKLQ